MKIYKSTRVYGAENPFETDLPVYGKDEEIENVDVEEVDEESEDFDPFADENIQDPILIETDNNISNHYIAECDACKGIFITAVISSDAKVDSITGICPLCEQESTQYLRWLITAVEEVNDDGY